MTISVDTSGKLAMPGGAASYSAGAPSRAVTLGGIQGALVVVVTYANAGADNGSSVTWGGVSVPAVVGGLAVDTVTEPGAVKAYFLGANIPQGGVTITVNRTNNAVVMIAYIVTILANALGTEVTGTTLQQADQAPAETNITDGSPIGGTSSMRFAAAFYGGNSPPGAGANSTALQNDDQTSFGSAVARETTAGTGSRPVGFSAVSDDFACVLFAVRESLVGRALKPGPANHQNPAVLMERLGAKWEKARDRIWLPNFGGAAA